jgi:L-serine dehydratase
MEIDLADFVKSFALASPAKHIQLRPMPESMLQSLFTTCIAAITAAHTFADLALAGRDAVLPLHEVIDVADQVGRRLPPELLCASRGGVCIAPSSLIRADEFRDCFKETQAQGVTRPPGNLN